MSLVHNMPCPDCKTKIPFNPMQLVNGVKFSCPNCKAVIGISKDSLPKAKNALTRFEQVRKKAVLEGIKKNNSKK